MITFIKDDTLNVMKKIENENIDLIITDPPYGVSFQNNKYFDDTLETLNDFLPKWIENMYRILKENRHIYMFIPTLNADIFIKEFKKYFKLNNILSCKSMTTNRYLKNNFCYDNQLILFGSKNIARRFNKVDYQKTSSCWLKDKRNKNPKEYSYQYSSFIEDLKATEKNRIHPTEKNNKLIETFILLSSNINETVFDPFCGSKNVLKLSDKNKRNAIGCDLIDYDNKNI